MRSLISYPALLLIALSLTGCSNLSGVLGITGPTEQTAPGLISDTPNEQPAESLPEPETTSEATAEIATEEPPMEPAAPVSITNVGNIGLQLGAFSSAEGASRHLLYLKETYPLLFEGRSPIVRTKAELSRTLYRVVLGPFTSRELAQEFCSQLKVRQEACFVADYNRVEMNTTN